MGRALPTRAKAEVVVAEAEGEPLEPNSVDEGEAEVAVTEVEGEPSSRTLSTKAKLSSPKVDDEPLEPNSVDEGEGEVVDAEGRWRVPRAERCRRG